MARGFSFAFAAPNRPARHWDDVAADKAHGVANALAHHFRGHEQKPRLSALVGGTW